MAKETIAVDCTGPVTVAVVRRSDGEVAPVLFGDESFVSSGVFVADDGRLLVGRDGVEAAGLNPGRYVSAPARLLPVAAGRTDHGADPVDLVAAVLRMVRDQTADHQVEHVALVVPPSWGPQRRTAMRVAAERAGFARAHVVDAVTAVLAGAVDVGRGHTLPDGLVLVYRQLGPWCEVTVVRRNGGEWDRLATFEQELNTDAEAIDVVVAALSAAEAEPSDVGVVIGHGPADVVANMNGLLRQRGISARASVVTAVELVRSALQTRQPEPHAPFIAAVRHVIGIGVTLAGAVALLWFLPRTGVDRARLGSTLAREPRPPYLYTVWPTWSMVAVLALSAAVTAVLFAADVRRRRLPSGREADQRAFVGRGLRLAGAIGVAVGLLTGTLGANRYVTVPTAFFLAWTTIPVLLLAVVVAVITVLIQQGYTTALQWQIWLRLPTVSLVLTIAGLLMIEVYLYRTTSDYAFLQAFDLPDRVAELGAIAVGLAVVTLLFRRLTVQAIVSPFVIGAIAGLYSYTTISIVVGVLLGAMVAWWVTRLRPAAAFSDPTHPATVLAAKYEPAPFNDVDPGAIQQMPAGPTASPRRAQA